MGNPQSLVVTIPRGGVDDFSGFADRDRVQQFFKLCGHGEWQVGVAFFIFATADGTISGWSPGVDLTMPLSRWTIRSHSRRIPDWRF